MKSIGNSVWNSARSTSNHSQQRLLREEVLEVALQLHLTQENAQNKGILPDKLVCLQILCRCEAATWRLV
jgi:hypothetical protein